MLCKILFKVPPILTNTNHSDNHWTLLETIFLIKLSISHINENSFLCLLPYINLCNPNIEWLDHLLMLGRLNSFWLEYPVLFVVLMWTIKHKTIHFIHVNIYDVSITPNKVKDSIAQLMLSVWKQSALLFSVGMLRMRTYME